MFLGEWERRVWEGRRRGGGVLEEVFFGWRREGLGGGCFGEVGGEGRRVSAGDEKVLMKRC